MYCNIEIIKFISIIINEILSNSANRIIFRNLYN